MYGYPHCSGVISPQHNTSSMDTNQITLTLIIKIKSEILVFTNIPFLFRSLDRNVTFKIKDQKL